MANSKVYGYARVSSREQNLDRQLEALKAYGIDPRDIITDKASGKDFKRQGYQTLKTQLLRAGDTLVIKELDRLGRNMDHIKDEWRELQELGIDIVVLDQEMLNTKGKSDLEKTLIRNIVFELLCYTAQKEREKTAQRRQEGIAIAKANGKHLGRPKAEYPDNWETVYNKWQSGEITALKAMELTKLKRTTFYKLVKQFEEDNRG